MNYVQNLQMNRFVFFACGKVKQNQKRPTGQNHSQLYQNISSQIFQSGIPKIKVIPFLGEVLKSLNKGMYLPVLGAQRTIMVLPKTMSHFGF